jgi:hypothetical protein
MTRGAHIRLRYDFEVNHGFAGRVLGALSALAAESLDLAGNRRRRRRALTRCVADGVRTVHTVVVRICRGRRAGLVARIGLIVSICLAGVVLAACGAERSATQAPATLPSSGRAYRALTDRQRTAVAATCRDRVASRAHGLAARQLHAVDAAELRNEIDTTYYAVVEQRRPVADVCEEVIAFVTPGLRVSFDGAKDQRDGTFTFQTSSDKLLTIRGLIDPAPSHARVVARREVGSRAAHTAAVGADGRFVIPRLHLRKIADNSFRLTIYAPPNAPRKLIFSAICLDCLAGTTPPSAQQ